jgi:thioredoxin reductase (NADPH)
MFTGEVNLLSGRRGFTQIRVSESGEVIEVDRDQLLALVQTDSELSDILMRAFILRRVELIAHGFGDVVLIGSNHCAGTIRLKEFLTRNGHPYAFINLDQDAGVQDLLDHFHVGVEDVPVLICRGEVVLRDPTNQQIADCLGFNEAIDQTHVRDLVIVGAGPRALRRRSTARRKGLTCWYWKRTRRAGRPVPVPRSKTTSAFPQASRVRNSRRAPTHRRRSSAPTCSSRKAQPVSPASAGLTPLRSKTGRVCRRARSSSRREPSIAGCRSITSRSLKARGSTTAQPLLNRSCAADEEVIVVGGGNSAGQAAVFLAQTARRVHLLVRSDGLAETMSRYLIRRIEESPTIVFRPQTEIVALEGDGHLERVRWQNHQTGESETLAIRHVFVMAGAVPNTHWLDGCVALDAKGFIKTGPDLTPEDLAAAHWPLRATPHLLETSLPGVFAVGDVRGGSLKRVASAVGEGSIAVAFVHQALHE